LAERVNVMYGGTLVEMAPSKPLFSAPAHPYTLGLLSSLPSLDTDSDQDLSYINGSPPDMIHLPPGCPFWPRCSFRTKRCTQERPELIEVAEGHTSACWHIDRVLEVRRSGSAEGAQ